MEEKFAEQKRRKRTGDVCLAMYIAAALVLLVELNLFAAISVDIKPELS